MAPIIGSFHLSDVAGFPPTQQQKQPTFPPLSDFASQSLDILFLMHGAKESPKCLFE